MAQCRLKPTGLPCPSPAAQVTLAFSLATEELPASFPTSFPECVGDVLKTAFKGTQSWFLKEVCHKTCELHILQVVLLDKPAAEATATGNMGIPPYESTSSLDTSLLAGIQNPF